MTRVVAGAAGGRRLAVPSGTGTRPTSDRAREALFSTLESLVGSFAGRRVADLYSGSGAVGLESLSRGAAHCLLVEADPVALRVLRGNVATLALPGAEVYPGRVERMVTDVAPGPAYDVMFLDPPFELPDADLRAVLELVVGNDWLAGTAVVVVERASRGPGWQWPSGLTPVRSRRYGEATLWYGRADDRARPPGSETSVEQPGE